MGGKSGVLPSLFIPPRPPFTLTNEAAKEIYGTCDNAEHLSNLRCDGRRCVERYGRGCVDVFRDDRVFATPGKDVQTIFISRFFGGFFGACPLTCVGAVFADMFNNRQRGLAITVFSMTVFSGPLLAPFIGGFISMSYLGW